MVMESKFGLMEEYTKGCMNRGRKMVLGNIFGLMVQLMKEIGFKTKLKDRENINGLMDVIIRVVG